MIMKAKKPGKLLKFNDNPKRTLWKRKFTDSELGYIPGARRRKFVKWIGKLGLPSIPPLLNLLVAGVLGVLVYMGIINPIIHFVTLIILGG